MVMATTEPPAARAEAGTGWRRAGGLGTKIGGEGEGEEAEQTVKEKEPALEMGSPGRSSGAPPSSANSPPKSLCPFPQLGEAPVFVPAPPQPRAAPGSATIPLVGLLEHQVCWQAPLSHIPSDVYPWNTVVHLDHSRWSPRCLLMKMQKWGRRGGFLRLQVANMSRLLQQKAFSDCILSSLQKKVNSGMFWGEEWCSD